MSPVFLTVDEVLELHAFQIEQFGGDPGIRDMGLLESAVAQASQQFASQFLHEDLTAMAGRISSTLRKTTHSPTATSEPGCMQH